MGDHVYACGKCPRTFKLVEFYEKEQPIERPIFVSRDRGRRCISSFEPC